MYRGSVKVKDFEKEIGEKNMNNYIKKVCEEFTEKEKVYLYFMTYEQFEDKYTNPYLEKKGNYLLNILLFNILGKKEYKRIGRLFNGKRMCITLCKTNKNWDYGELQKYFEINKEKNIEDMMCDLDIKDKSYIRKLKERTQRVTKDSL